MNMKIAMHEDPRIIEARAKVEEAERELGLIASEIRSGCSHEAVVETPWTEYRNAKRTCLRCGQSETGSHWSGGKVWSEENFNPSIMGDADGRLVLKPDQVAAYQSGRQTGGVT